MSFISKEDLYFFNQGKLFDSYRIFGAHLLRDKAGSFIEIGRAHV